MTIQAKRFLVPLDGDYGGPMECTDDNDPDYGEDGEAVEVGYWVGEREEDDAIGFELDGGSHFVCFETNASICRLKVPVVFAGYVAEAIEELIAWSKTAEGKKEIARLRATQQRKSARS